LSHDKDIVSGLYYALFGPLGKKRKESVAWKNVTPEELEKIKIKFPEFVKANPELRKHLTKEEIESGDIQEVIIPSAGCMLITSGVFKKIKYGLLDVPGTSDDVFFCRKAREAGFKLYCDPSIECEHLTDGKFKVKDGELRHPALI